MGKRLNQERQKRLEPTRMSTAMEKFSKLNLNPVSVNNNSIEFEYKGNTIKYFPYSGWASGKGIQDGRGLKNLIKQIV